MIVVMTTNLRRKIMTSYVCVLPGLTRYFILPVGHAFPCTSSLPTEFQKLAVAGGHMTRAEALEARWQVAAVPRAAKPIQL